MLFLWVASSIFVRRLGLENLFFRSLKSCCQTAWPRGIPELNAKNCFLFFPRMPQEVLIINLKYTAFPAGTFKPNTPFARLWRMALSNLQKNLHLLWRAGFGPSLDLLPTLAARTPAQTWQQLMADSRVVPAKIQAYQPLLYRAQMQDLPDTAKEATRKELIREGKLELQRLSGVWLETLMQSKAQLRERMAFFWHSHFATRVTRVDFNRDLLHIFREKGMGKFGDLLLEVSKSSAMLNFLNNQQNRKQNPNENFAREVMELFTLGRGNYTEKDVKEGARAFTGWSYTIIPESSNAPNAGETYFVFRQQAHDDGVKTFLGQTGNFNGEDIIRILLQQRQTARFISGKIYRYFVNETPDNKRIESLSQMFYDSGYDIGALLQEIFTAPWFFEEKNVGNRIKSPVDLLAGIGRMLPLKVGNPSGLFILQNVLGQTLLQPPNVAGWPMGNAWIDSSSLLLRMQLPYILAGKEALTVAPKPNDDIQMGKMSPAQNLDIKPAFAPRLLQSQVEWAAVEKSLGGLSLSQDASYLLLFPEKAPLSAVGQAVKNLDATSRATQTVLRLMSLPEYQLS